MIVDAPQPRSLNDLVELERLFPQERWRHVDVPLPQMMEELLVSWAADDRKGRGCAKDCVSRQNPTRTVDQTVDTPVPKVVELVPQMKEQRAVA